MTKEEKVSRRGYVGIAAAGIVGVAIGAAGGYYAAPGAEEKIVTETMTQAITKTVTAGVATTPTPTMSSADIAVEAAKKFAGTKISIVAESGFDEFEYRAFADDFQKLTGVEIEVIPLPTFAVQEKVITEGIAKSGAVDLVSCFPIWFPDLILGNFIISLNDYIEQFTPDMTDFIYFDYMSGMRWAKDKVYALPIDGDVFLVYYRKDLFENPDERQAFKNEYNYDLAPPKTWREFTEIAKFFTRDPGDKLAGETVEERFGGQIEFRAKGGVFWWFFNRMSSYGARYFNKTANDLEPTINTPECVQALNDMKEATPWGIPEAEAVSWGETIGVFEAGGAAMNIFWPMMGKHAQFMEGTTIDNKLGYALMPGTSIDRRSIMAAGKSLCVTSDSRNPEAAYLFAQWLTSPEILMKIVSWHAPGALGALDPVRRRQFADPQSFQAEFGDTWPGATEYLKACEDNLRIGMPDIILPGWAEFQETIDTELSNAIVGQKTPENALNDAADQWKEIIEKYGKDKCMEWYHPEIYEPGGLQW